ncbi:tyrosine-protein kinase YwqD [bacterium BMS3Bbin09]|nr:tyrosine-protein kinase YwqD [bacterium BMS3Bbin09]
MSKLEEALEKANKLRESGRINEAGKVDVARETVPIEVNNKNLVTITQPYSPVAEEYRKLKSMILRKTKKDFLNTIMITSAIEGEGKSVTSINLAVTLAQAIDHSILLIDADIRKPMIHEYLGIEYKYGLSDYLTSDIDISEVMIKTGIGKLVLIPAGSSVDNPLELLSSEKMKALIKEVKQRYVDRYVIIDTPPILSFAESIAIGANVDGIIFVVKEGRAPKRMIEDALNLVKGLNLLGVVFNGVEKTSLDGQYSRYYKDKTNY